MAVPIICAEPTWHLQNWPEVDQFKDIIERVRTVVLEATGGPARSDTSRYTRTGPDAADDLTI